MVEAAERSRRGGLRLLAAAPSSANSRKAAERILRRRGSSGARGARYVDIISWAKRQSLRFWRLSFCIGHFSGLDHELSDVGEESTLAEIDFFEGDGGEELREDLVDIGTG